MSDKDKLIADFRDWFEQSCVQLWHEESAPEALAWIAMESLNRRLTTGALAPARIKLMQDELYRLTGTQISATSADRIIRKVCGL